MAFTATLVDRGTFGHLNLKVFNITGVQSSGSTLETGFGTVKAVKAINNSDSSDTFKENVGAQSSSSTRGQITLTSATDNDAGHVWVWGR